MGKGYNNYMCKKPFHPGSKANIKRTWMAEQRTENEKKKQDDLKVQYEKEQDLYNNRALISTESKDKLELNFMYEAPPGAKRERQKEDDEPEYKFEWQRKYNAPREDFAKGNTEIRDQPFGIPVRNVRCIKCHKWGHINTDKECPLFSQASTSVMPTTSMDPLELMHQMREDGYNIKQSVLGHHLNPQAANQQLLESEEEDPEVEFLQSLTSKQKHKLLKKLNKLSKKQAKRETSCSSKKKNKKRKSKRKSFTESESDEEQKRKKARRKAKRNVAHTSEVQSFSESSGYEDKKETVTKQTVKSIGQKLENANISSHSDPVDDIVKEKHGKGSGNKSSCKKFEQTKQKHKVSSASKIITLKRCKKDSGCESSNSDKSCDAENKMQIKQEMKGTASKPESKRKPSDLSVDSASSNEQSSPANSESELKQEHSDLAKGESSDDQSPKLSSKATGYKKLPSRSHVKVTVNPAEISSSEVSNSPEHPDRFTCSHSSPEPGASEPGTSKQANLATFLLERKYHGGKDEKFRRFHRDRRSPSFKQKYRLA